MRHCGQLYTDPTYKEWKHLPCCFHFLTSVCFTRILPTRNGNFSPPVVAVACWRTRILPTRNGNFDFSHLTCSVCSHGSYLQGMETELSSPGVLSHQDHTDPTYKEWKHMLLQKYPMLITDTDPTYKEWKLVSYKEGNVIAS